MKAAPRVQPLPRTRVHSPRSTQASVQLSQTPREVSGSAGTVSCTDQLFIFAPSITQFILQKKKHLLCSGIYKYLPQFSLLITKSVTKAYSTLCTKSIQTHHGAPVWHPASQHRRHRAPSARSALLRIGLWNAAGVSRRVTKSLWAGVSAERSQFFL